MLVVGLDIGTTKVCAVVGEVGEDGITILGVSQVPCRGLRKGIVSNIDWTVRSIKDAIEAAQTMAGVEIRTVYAGVAGSPTVITYSGAKAYSQIFSEGLWWELGQKGVDVLHVVVFVDLVEELLDLGPRLRVLNLERILRAPADPNGRDGPAEAGRGRGQVGPRWPPGIGCHPVEQRGDDFAARLVNAHADAAAATGRPVLQIGMDTPQVSPALLTDCARALLTAPAVLGMASDGGWWVLGVAEPASAKCLLDVPMSRSNTGAVTLRALQHTGVSVTLVPELRDVDTVDDIVAVRNECGSSSRFVATTREAGV